MSPIVFPTTPIRKDLLMAQATKTRFDKEGVVYVQLRDTWFRIEGEEGNPVPEGFNPNELLTAEQLQAHFKAQAADLSAESPKQRPAFALGQVWRMADGQEMTVVALWEDQSIFRFVSGEDGEWLHPNGLAHSQEGMGIIAVEYLRETDRPRLEVGKKYRTASGKIVEIVEDDGDHSYPFHDESGHWYHQFGFACGGGPDDEIVALVEDDPAKAAEPPAEPETPKQRPAFAIGQVWRMADGQEATVIAHDKCDRVILFAEGKKYEWFNSDGTMLDGTSRGVVAVEYLRETDRPRLEVGKKYRTASGEIVKIVESDGSTVPFRGDNGKWYQHFGLGAKDPIVALVEDEPAKGEDEPAQPEAPKQESASSSPTLEVGKKYRMVGGKIVTIIEDDKTDIYRFRGDNGFWYTREGRSNSRSPDHKIVALIEFDLSKKNPPLAIGQVWKMRNGEETTICGITSGGRFFHTIGFDKTSCVNTCGTNYYKREELDLVEFLRDLDRPRIEVGKKYRTKSGDVFFIEREKDGVFLGKTNGGGTWFYPLGFQVFNRSDDEPDLVALVEDEPAQPAEASAEPEAPKKNPPLAVGQVWRMRNGEEVLLHREYAPGRFHGQTSDGFVSGFGGITREFGDFVSGFALMEYLRETDRVRIELGRDYLRSDGKKVKIAKDIDNGGRFVDNLGLDYHQFSHCNNTTLDKDLPTAGDEVSYFCQDSDKWLSGWIVRGTSNDGGKTFLIPKGAEDGDYTRHCVETERVRIDVRSVLPPIRIGDLWRRRDGELQAINFACSIDMTESHYPGGDLVCRVGKAMAAAGELVAQFVHYKDAIAFVKQNTTDERRLILASQANRHECPEMGKWFVHKILYVNAPAIEIE